MCIQYQGLTGKIYLIGDKLAGGGEGNIHQLQNDDSRVAKIFKPERRSSEREEKLRLMVQNGLSADKLRDITWPQDVLYGKEGFVGYIMSRVVHTEPLTSIYSTGTDNQYNMYHRLLAAINLCDAVKTVHDMGQVCGDLNPLNICINLDMNDNENGFHVTLVDTDSYHFRAGDRTYRCEVGLADYIAPEVQSKMTGGMNLKNAPLPTYTKETDLFALAVHIFALLMNGCHPFACAKAVNGTWEHTMPQMSASVHDSVVAPQPIDNIRDGFFPFYEKRPGITTPVYAPSFDALPSELRNLFVRTFVAGYNEPQKRAEASEWITALMQVKDGVGIAKCNSKPNHYYFNHNLQCPLCEVEKNIGGMIGGVSGTKIISGETGSGGSQGGGGQTVRQKSSSGTGKDHGIFISMAAGIVIMITIAIAALFKGNPVTNTYEPASENTASKNTVTETTAPTPKERYRSIMAEAQKLHGEKKFDAAIESCNEALKIYGNSQLAYYVKAMSWKGKGHYTSALETVNTGIDLQNDSEIADDLYVYDKMLALQDECEEKTEEIKQKQKKAQKEKKERKKQLKYGKKIIRKIRGRHYKTALKLIKRGYEKAYLEDKNKIYIKNGKIVNKINKGKGFVYYIWGGYAYLGKFKNGKASGSGTEVGNAEYSSEAYGGYYTIKGKFKNGYPNGRCTVFYSKWDSDSSATFIGTYKRGWENGSFILRVRGFAGEHSDTYYFSSAMGTRKLRKIIPKGYVWAEADSGWRYYFDNRKDLKGYATPHHGKK